MESGQIDAAMRLPASPVLKDSNCFVNVDIDSKAAGQGMIPPNIGENLALLNNGGNGDSMPATVPAPEIAPYRSVRSCPIWAIHVHDPQHRQAALAARRQKRAT